MNKLDGILQKERPTVMVPKYEALPVCPVRKTRFLMGRDGLYIETQQPWGRLVKLLWSSPLPLPYGDVCEVDEFKDVLKCCMEEIISSDMTYKAGEYAHADKEWGGLILFDEGEGFYYRPLDFDATVVSLDYRRNIPKGESLVVDVHSHGSIPPGFSAKDNKDDRGGVRICVVLGNYVGEGKPPQRFDVKARYVVEGFFFNVEVERETLFT